MRGTLVLYDISLLIVALIVYGSSFTLAAAFFAATGFMPWPWRGFVLPLTVLVFVLGVIAMVAFLGRLLPRMEEGHYPGPVSKAFYVWTAYLTLNRMIFLMPIKNIVLYSSILRFLAFRALGCKLAYGTSISANVEFTDLPLIEVGEGSIIGAWSLLSGHYLNKGNLYLGKIVIGQRVNVGGYCRIGPGVTIGNDSWIGADCQIAPMVTIGSGCTIEPLSVIQPGTQIPDGTTWPLEDEVKWE